MEKTAQKRSLLSKLREMTNIGGIAAEKFFHPEFQELMDRLRNETDDPIRAIVSGEQIGDADAPSDGISLKDILKSARSNLNRREYMRAIAEMGRFHDKMDLVVRILSTFRSNIDAIHEKFLFQDLDDESKKHLHDLKNRMAQSSHTLIKEAGLMDLLTNLATERGRALSAWEKRYPKQVGKLKKDSESLMKRSEGLLSTTLSALKEMATARATRKVDNYIQSGEKLAKAYRSYDAEFRKFYADNVKGFLEKQELVAPVKPVSKPQEIGKQEIQVAPKVEDTLEQAPSTIPEPPKPIPVEHLHRSLMPGERHVPDPDDSIPIPLVDKSSLPTPKAPPPEMTTPPPLTPSQMYQQIQQPGGLAGLRHKPLSPELAKKVLQELPTERPGAHKQSHQKFFASLETMGSEHSSLLAAHIKKYAHTIQDTDPQMASQLLQLVQRIQSE